MDDNITEEKRRTTMKMKVPFTLALSILGVVVALFYFTSTSTAADPIPGIDEYDDYSVLTCTGDLAEPTMEAIAKAYGSGGDADAYRLATEAIKHGICAFDERNSLTWLPPDMVEEGSEYEKYVDRECQVLANGHCVAVQPVFVEDPNEGGVGWDGYMLVKPRLDGSVPPPTVADRHVKGLFIDMNIHED